MLQRLLYGSLAWDGRLFETSRSSSGMAPLRQPPKGWADDDEGKPLSVEEQTDRGWYMHDGRPLGKRKTRDDAIKCIHPDKHPLAMFSLALGKHVTRAEMDADTDHRLKLVTHVFLADLHCFAIAPANTKVVCCPVRGRSLTGCVMHLYYAEPVRQHTSPRHLERY